MDCHSVAGSVSLKWSTQTENIYKKLHLLQIQKLKPTSKKRHGKLVQRNNVFKQRSLRRRSYPTFGGFFIFRGCRRQCGTRGSTEYYRAAPEMSTWWGDDSKGMRTLVSSLFECLHPPYFLPLPNWLFFQYIKTLVTVGRKTSVAYLTHITFLPNN